MDNLLFRFIFTGLMMLNLILLVINKVVLNLSVFLEQVYLDNIVVEIDDLVEIGYL